MQGPPPPPPGPGSGKPLFKEDNAIKQILGSDHNEFKRILSEKDIRIKTWNTLLTDPDKKSSDFATLFKNDKETFKKLLAEIDTTGTGQAGVSKIKLMLQGKPTDQKPKPIKPQTGGINPLPYITSLQKLILELAPNSSPLIASKLLNQTNVDEFKKFFHDNTSQQTTEEMVNIYKEYKKAANEPLGNKQPSSSNVDSINRLASALSSIKP